MNDVGKELYNEMRDSYAKLGISVDTWDELSDTDKTAWHWVGQFASRKGYGSIL